MGITRFAGPVYGAKALLLQCSRETPGDNQSDVEQYEFTVPSDEDWLITNASVYCTTEAAAATCDIKDDGTSILGSAIAMTAGAHAAGTITATAGEDEGKLVEGGSAITIHLTTGATGPTNVQIAVHGYIRAGATKKAGAVVGA